MQLTEAELAPQAAQESSSGCSRHAAERRLVFVTDEVPTHNGSPKARLAYLYYRLFSLFADARCVVLDSAGDAFRARARLAEDCIYISSPRLCRKDNGEIVNPSAKKISAAIQRKLSVEDGVQLRILTQSSVLSDEAAAVLQAFGDIQALDDIAVSSKDIFNSLASLIVAVEGRGFSERERQIVLTLPADQNIAAGYLSFAFEVARSAGRILGLDLKLDIFGCSRPEIVMPCDQRLECRYRHWPDLTGVLASSPLLLNFLGSADGADYLSIMANGLGTVMASPSGIASKMPPALSRGVRQFSGADELLELVSRLLVVPTQAVTEEPTEDFERLTHALSAHFHIPRRQTDAVLTRESFLFDNVSPARRSAFCGQTTVYYVPFTGLLGVEALLHRESGVNELRFYNADDDAELGRVVALRKEYDFPHQPISGGFILFDTPLPARIILKAFSSGRYVSSQILTSNDIKFIRSELASLYFDPDNFLKAEGVIWSDAPGRVLELRLPLDNAYRLAPSAGGDSGAPSWSVFDVTCPLEALPGSKVKLLDATEWNAYIRPCRVGSALAGGPGINTSNASELRDIHKGRRAWMVGNGPSVRLEDLDKIASQGDIVFCFNRFHLAYGDTALREDYVVSADALMIEDFGQEMIDQSAGRAIFCVHAKKRLEFNGDYLRVNALDTDMPLFSKRADHSVHIGGSSVFVAMQMAYFFGVRDIVTYGMDYSFTQTPVFDPRYPMPVCFDEGNHFIKGYRAQKPWCPPNWRDISFGFLKARTVFEASGGRIINATRGGKLEIFERMDFDAVINEKVA